MTHPDDYGKRPRVVTPPRQGGDDDPPAFLTDRSGARGLRAVESAVSKFADQITQREEAPIAPPQEIYQDQGHDPRVAPPVRDPLEDVKNLMASLPTLKCIEVAEGILAVCNFNDKPPAAIDLAVGMAKWGSGVK